MHGIEDLIPIPGLDQDDRSESIYITQQERARQAKDILENELFQQSFQELRAYLLHHWERTEPHEQHKREAIWGQFQAANLFYENLKILITTGKAAGINLDTMKKQGRLKRLKDLF